MNLNTNKQACNPLKEWNENFEKDVLSLHQLINLRTHEDDYASRNDLESAFQSLNASLSQIEKATDHIREYVREEEANIPQLQDAMRNMEALLMRMATIREKLPPQLISSFVEREEVEPALKENDAAADNVSPCEIAEQPKSRRGSEPQIGEEDAVRKVTKKVSGKGSRPPPPKPGTTLGTKPKAKATKPKKDVASHRNERSVDLVISPVSEEELNTAPQYVRGRMTVDKLSAVANRLSEIATAKYTLLRKPNSSLSTTEMSHCQNFQESRCDETHGLKFLTDAEIKGFGKYRIDSTVKAGINLLRHFGMLKEVRGKNRERVLIINDVQ